MKKIIFTTVLIAAIVASCNQKNKETITDQEQTTATDHTVIANDSLTGNSVETIDADLAKYACSMHPEVQGKLNDKCPECGMKLTEPVAETTESK